MKRSLVYLILLAMLLAVLVWFYFIKDSYEILPLTAHNGQIRKQKESWFNYDAPAKDFKVSVPLLPQTATQDLLDPITGETRHYEMYVATSDIGTIYMINTITFPKEMDETLKSKTLKSVISDMVAANPGNKLKSKREVSYEGKSAIDFMIENESTLIQAREFFSGQTLYVLYLISKKEVSEDDHFEQFIQSFKLTEKEK